MYRCRVESPLYEWTFFDEEETNGLQLYVNDVEKSLLFYKKIIALKLSIQMDISSELRIKKVNMKNVYLFL
ncbi:hypothetical protein BKK39_29655 [Bacillus cereus]|nr:hypothetical protein BAQ46_01305 [Bacillus paranthracis]ONG66037.1 hypothetical protein BKK43_29090 [Bacillus cereus]ONG72517.1 hypothetical protein BKK44_09830 [Bacillus cereus]ONG76554.1 hypothetical protein BKK42_26385 [Bacillus cereus]ONG85505.1 hypothetical protein BKK40_28150 [Bacillus cereus]